MLLQNFTKLKKKNNIKSCLNIYSVDHW